MRVSSLPLRRGSLLSPTARSILTPYVIGVPLPGRRSDAKPLLKNGECHAAGVSQEQQLLSKPHSSSSLPLGPQKNNSTSAVLAAAAAGICTAILFACGAIPSPIPQGRNSSAATATTREEGRASRSKDLRDLQAQQVGPDGNSVGGGQPIPAALSAARTLIHEHKAASMVVAAAGSLLLTLILARQLASSLPRSSRLADASPSGGSSIRGRGGSRSSSDAGLLPSDLPSPPQAVHEATDRTESLLGRVDAGSKPSAIPAQGRVVGAGQPLKVPKLAAAAPGPQTTVAGAGTEVAATAPSKSSQEGSTQRWRDAAAAAAESGAAPDQYSRWASRAQLRGSGYVLPDDAANLVPEQGVDGSLVFSLDKLTAPASSSTMAIRWMDSDKMTLAEQIRQWSSIFQRGTQREVAEILRTSMDPVQAALSVASKSQGCPDADSSNALAATTSTRRAGMVGFITFRGNGAGANSDRGNAGEGAQLAADETGSSRQSVVEPSLPEAEVSLQSSQPRDSRDSVLSPAAPPSPSSADSPVSEATSNEGPQQLAASNQEAVGAAMTEWRIRALRMRPASSQATTPEQDAEIAQRVQAAADAVKLESLQAWVCAMAREKEAAWEVAQELLAALAKQEAALDVLGERADALQAEAARLAAIVDERLAALAAEAARQEALAKAAAEEEARQAEARAALLRRQQAYREKLEAEWAERKAAWSEREAAEREQQRLQAIRNEELYREAVAKAQAAAEVKRAEEAAAKAAAEEQAQEEKRQAEAAALAALEAQRARERAEQEAEMTRQAVAAHREVLAAQARAAEAAEAEMRAAVEQAAAAAARALEEQEAAARDAQRREREVADAQASAEAARRAAEVDSTAARKVWAAEAAMYANKVAAAAAFNGAIAQQAVIAAQATAEAKKQELLHRREAALARLEAKEQRRQAAQQRAEEPAYWASYRSQVRTSISMYGPLMQLSDDEEEAAGQWQEVAHEVLALEGVVGTVLPRYSPLEVMTAAHPQKFMAAYQEFERMQTQPLSLDKTHPAISAWIKAAANAAAAQDRYAVPAWKLRPVWAELEGPCNQAILEAAKEAWPSFALELEFRHRKLHDLVCKGTEPTADDDDGCHLRGLTLLATLAAWQATEPTEDEKLAKSSPIKGDGAQAIGAAEEEAPREPVASR